MNYLHNLFEFETPEDGLEKLKEAEKIRDSMVGALYYGILYADCLEISAKIKWLEKERRKNKSQIKK